MSQTQFQEHKRVESDQPMIPLWDLRVFRQTQIRFRVLQILSIVAGILIIVWVIQKQVIPATPKDTQGDLAPALIPILAAAISINLFLEIGIGIVEQNDRTLVAFLGHGMRWLKQAMTEVMLAREFQMVAYERYSSQLGEINKITEQITKTKNPEKVVELATARLKAARDLVDLARSRVNDAENYLDGLVDHSSYRNFKSSVANYFSILLGLLVAAATSMQIFALMGVQLDNPKMDMILTGLFIGGLVYPVHQVIGNLWDILTKLAKR